MWRKVHSRSMPPLGPQTKHSTNASIDAGREQGILDVSFLHRMRTQTEVRKKRSNKSSIKSNGTHLEQLLACVRSSLARG